ncbi:hypothetical protein M758_6G178400 [Ceratodon purpureus]|nr:hypothetical protein M758_6G178400 [Ceratodon purpureus]
MVECSAVTGGFGVTLNAAFPNYSSSWLQETTKLILHCRSHEVGIFQPLFQKISAVSTHCGAHARKLWRSSSGYIHNSSEIRGKRCTIGDSRRGTLLSKVKSLSVVQHILYIHCGTNI